MRSPYLVAPIGFPASGFWPAAAYNPVAVYAASAGRGWESHRSLSGDLAV